MAMLAERKSKQKWSHDPRNKAWSTNTDRFGYQMLTKMGWSAGKGLGANESGSTSHVKVSLKNNNLGVGAKASQEDNWLAHQEDFNDLLAHLNRANNSDAGNEDSDSGAKNKDMETIARNSKKRVFYQRFIKSKNTSSYSAEDMACIMGQRSKSAPDSPADLSENEDSDDSCASCPVISETHDLGMTTITSKQSVQDYFAMKMAELKEKRRLESSAGQDMTQGTNNEEDDREETLDVASRKKQKKKARKRTDDVQEDIDDSEKTGVKLSDDKIPKKKKKKSKKRELNEDEEDEESTSEVAINKEDEKATSDDKSEKKKKKKEKKLRKKVEGVSHYDLRNLEDKKIKLQKNEESCENVKKRKRKNGKSKLEEEEICQNETKTLISKKKKKSDIDSIKNEDEKERGQDEKRKEKKKKEKQNRNFEIKINKGKTRKSKDKKAK
ncbi:PIN2/TERF1-interacting telomerase inhibitor 1-like [Actinia tenebrosa]|uniref:PIN2/TERF1-interacting telomerase inhibitor 1-like n=1 Tax=Actinia tenebrosa TaxID=6105 RepID=A0A6P8HLH7_ACTTE|nr:PIN2/TERF1-interacting telomerase inhibitor 1-like [Actinia tenebrosa]